jgi:8-oxo-dGTP pyrophosphatase MutT (NUDIX family)
MDRRIRVIGTLPYTFEPVDGEKAERERIPHGVAYCLAINPLGELLHIRRAKGQHSYPEHHSVPAGHMDMRESRCEMPYEAAKRELLEETQLEPRKIVPFMDDQHIYDKLSGHVAFAFLMPVEDCSNLKFNDEIDHAYSRFEQAAEVQKLLMAFRWTPPSKIIVSELLRLHGSDLAGLYSSLLAGRPVHLAAP